MNEIVAQNSSTALVKNSGVDPFEAYANAISPRTIVGELLKFSKGDYLVGEEGKVLKTGTKFTANLDELLVGWIKWQGGKPVEHRMVRVADGIAAAARTDLGDANTANWEKDKDGEAKDPWQFSNYLPLLDAEGKLYTFTTSSRGGLGAIGELARRYGRHRRHNPDVHPVITLDVDSYQHKNKEFGRIKFPQFTAAGYEQKARFSEAMAAAGYAVSEVQSVEEDTADEFNDAISF